MSCSRVFSKTVARPQWRPEVKVVYVVTRSIQVSSQRWHSSQRKMSVLSTEAGAKSPTSESAAASSPSADLPPHSLMPTSMLLRASLVSTISSKPWLLNIALSTLTFLSSTRIPFLQVNKNPVIHALLKQTFYNHFCAGENGAEVTSTIQNLKNIGFKGVILTYAKEIVVDASLEEKGKGTLDAERGETDMTEPHSPDIDSWKEGVLTTVGLLGEDDFLALKLTGAGASVMTSLSTTKTVPKQMSSALEEICTQALSHNVRILVDAEQQSVQHGIDAIALDLMRKYNRTGTTATVYNTYQAYLKSTPDTLRAHMDVAASENFNLGVKLVRGAYMASEPRHLINDTKVDTDKSYDGIAEGLLQQSHAPFSDSKNNKSSSSGKSDSSYPSVSLFLATHNKDSATTAHNLHKSRVASQSPTIQNVQYGQLLGMADEVSCSLLQMGQRERAQQPPSESGNVVAAAVVPEVYKCLSWGPLQDCLSYLLRRARENKDAVGRSKAEYSAVWAEVRRRMRGSVGL